MILSGTVSHTRYAIKKHHFAYKSWYIALPACGTEIPVPGISRNHPGFISLHDKDYGYRDSRSVATYINDTLVNHLKNHAIDYQRILAVTMPRVAGFAFNPVTFFLCPNKEGNLLAVLCEVHNTFGEAHTYICRRSDAHPISPDDRLSAEKIFHVSPFFDRKGDYFFRFTCNENVLHVRIEYDSEDGSRRLNASLSGKWHVLTKRRLYSAMLKNPHPALKTWLLIHKHAFILWVIKRIRYVKKPLQESTQISETRE